MSLLSPLGSVVATAVPGDGCSPVAAVYDRRAFLRHPELVEGPSSLSRLFCHTVALPSFKAPNPSPCLPLFNPLQSSAVLHAKLCLPIRRYRGILLLALSLFFLPLHADITGTVTLQGKPGSEDETFSAKANGCGESPIRHTENWKVGPKGELADVVVWIVDPKFGAITGLPLPEIEVKQLGCRYIPHVIAVQAGVPFKITNGDPTLHNVRAKNYDGPGKPPGSDIFNFGQVRQGQTDEKQFDEPGIATLQCDVHAWMQCWVYALPSPCFGVTGTDGAFKLQSGDHLLDGDYKIRAWHPRFADQLEQTIHVKNGAAQVMFQFDGAKSF